MSVNTEEHLEQLELEKYHLNKIKEMCEHYSDSIRYCRRFGDGQGGGILLDMKEILFIEDMPTPAKAKKKSIGSSLKLRILKRDGYKCRDCGISDDLTLDHIIPESKGGDLSEENLQILCRSCNSRKGVKSVSFL